MIYVWFASLHQYNLTFRICFIFKSIYPTVHLYFCNWFHVRNSVFKKISQCTLVLNSIRCTGTLTALTLGINMHGVPWACTLTSLTLHGNGPQHNQQQAQMKLGIHNLELQQKNKQSTCLCYLYTETHSSWTYCCIRWSSHQFSNFCSGTSSHAGPVWMKTPILPIPSGDKLQQRVPWAYAKITTSILQPKESNNMPAQKTFTASKLEKSYDDPYFLGAISL